MSDITIPMPPETPAPSTAAPSRAPAAPVVRTPAPAPRAPAPAPVKAPAPSQNPISFPSFDVGGNKFVKPDGTIDHSMPVPSKDGAPDEVPFDGSSSASPVEPTIEVVAAKARDYTKFDDGDVQYLKSLGNKEFDKLAPVFEKIKNERAELAELKAKIPELEKTASAKPTFAHEHPDAYLLDPDFGNLLTAADNSDQISNFWHQQLINIENGEAYKAVQDGKLVEVPAAADGRVDVRAKVYAQQQLNRAAYQAEQARFQVESFRKDYAGEAKKSQEQLLATEKQLFPNFDEAKLSQDDKKNYDYAMNNLTPKAFRQHPQTRVLAKAYVSFQQLIGIANKLATENEQLRAPKARPAPTPTPGTADSDDDFVTFVRPE